MKKFLAVYLGSAAAKLFVNHPHFMYFPGERIEIMECLPIPGMQ